MFTIPELARVGMLESEAVAAGIDLDVRYTDTSGWYSNYRIGETTAAVKILVDQRPTRSSVRTCSAPSTANVINFCASPSNSTSPPANSSP